MLVLTRKYNESFIIGEPGPNQVVVKIVDIKKNLIKLGITAKQNVPIDRSEIYECKHGDLPIGV